MTTDIGTMRFRSPLAPLMEQFVREKQASGYRYDAGARLLQRFDRFLCGEPLVPQTLPRSVSRQWLAKQPHESAGTHQHRISVVRQFAQFMCRLGYPADVPDGRLAPRNAAGFAPRILRHAEVVAILSAVDQLAPTAQTPLRHLVMPEIFRLLYGCGFRVSELLRLRVADVDLDQGIITVREGKFGKDRLVPPAVPLVKRLQQYAAGLGGRPADAVFFPSHHDRPWTKGTVYALFRKLLYQCGIAHAGRGKGPRLHDMRHTYAVHTLLRWYREGADLDARLPILATYLGHQTLAGTQRYLHLTAELYPEITRRTNAAFGDVIPRRVTS
jgi:site-specific recombinase XerD